MKCHQTSSLILTSDSLVTFLWTRGMSSRVTLFLLVKILASRAKLSIRTVHDLKASPIVSGILKPFSTTFITLLMSKLPRCRWLPRILTTVHQYESTSLLRVFSSLSRSEGMSWSRINSIPSVSGNNVLLDNASQIYIFSPTYQRCPDLVEIHQTFPQN